MDLGGVWDFFFFFCVYLFFFGPCSPRPVWRCWDTHSTLFLRFMLAPMLGSHGYLVLQSL
jgi:hypothetical protein